MQKKYKYLLIDLDGTIINTISGSIFPKGIWDMKFDFNVLITIKNCEFDESYMGEAHDAEPVNVHDLIAKLENARDRAVMTATANGLSCREIEESTGIGRMTVQRTQDRVIATLRKMAELGQ